MAVLEVRGLKKSYKGVDALKGIDLDVEKGEIFGFLGANGAGKTTFTRCIVGVIHPTEGTIKIGGKSLPDREALREVGLVPDQFELYDHLTTRQNLQYFAELYGFKGEKAKRRVQAVLELVGMLDRADKKAGAFSHGMKQRTCIAQALLHQPKLLILDEPSNGLDPRGAYQLRQLMKRIAANGTTIFLNSHVMGEVESVCHRIAVIREGEVVAIDTPDALTHTKRTSITVQNPSKKFLALANKIAPTKPTGENVLQVQGAEAEIAEIIAAMAKKGAKITRVLPENNLEETFLALTEAP